MAMHALANVVRHPTHGENVSGAVKSQSIGVVKALAGHHLGVNGRKAPVVCLKGMFLERSGHPLDDIAAARDKSQKGKSQKDGLRVRQ
jgi:hypothetical protein